MAALSNLRKNILLAGEISATLYLALLVEEATPLDTGTSLAEVSYVGYQRVAVPTTSWGSIVDGVVLNDTAVVFPAVSSGSSIIIGFALCSALTAGDVRWFGPMTPTLLTSSEPDPPTVAAGSLLLAVQ